MIKNYWQVVSFVFEFGFIIALPLVIFGLGGKYLDQQLGTEPWLTLAAIFFAMTISSVWIYRYLNSLVKQ